MPTSFFAVRHERKRRVQADFQHVVNISEGHCVAFPPEGQIDGRTFYLFTVPKGRDKITPLLDWLYGKMTNPEVYADFFPKVSHMDKVKRDERRVFIVEWPSLTYKVVYTRRQAHTWIGKQLTLVLPFDE